MRTARAFAFFAFASLGVSLGSACGSEGTGESTPPPLSTATAAPTSDAGPSEAPDASSEQDAAPVDAGPDSVRWTGSLATTKAVEFGGSPYCKYEITLKQIEVDVTLTKTGEVVSAVVRNVATEASLPPCTYQPQAPSAHQYSFGSSKTSANKGLELTMTAASANKPKASLVVVGPLAGSSGVANVTLEWHRTDQPAPLDWRVTATVPVTRR